MNYNLDVLKALGDETRLNIVLNLLEKGRSVLDIVSLVGKSQPNVSIGLKKLEHAKIITAKKDGKRVFYSIIDKDRVEKILELINDEN
ncbi:MAG: winged helix-turn-helix transcriptional regulator [Nanoarchaeota archaeon]|nr:winged helix-turn-helix transcriptional regulator [Nanoarchaeota archaeon]